MTLLLPLLEREVEAPVVNPWHVLRRFYGNVNAHARARLTDGRRDIANLFL